MSTPSPIDSPPTTILVVDDDAMVRETFTALFAREPGHQLLGCAKAGAEGVSLARELEPDVILMDLNMPGMDGVEATAQITGEDPQACVVALTTFSDREHIVAMLQAGASGYLMKHTDRHTLVDAMAAAKAGEMPLAPEVRQALVATVVREHPVPADRPHLAPRERELLTWLAEGLSNKEIAQKMYLAEGSVKQYLSQIGEKLGRKSRTQILVRAIRLGLVDPHESNH
ncbi:response regulator [Aestuariimicrobium sp. Y1814]|uniref:response regulator n=1 Tax=Aestuariimicrobium sp. Y1814 TaxID=3418742 RepID=UPI003DA70018